MAASTASMCRRNDSAAVYSCIRANAEGRSIGERGALGLEIAPRLAQRLGVFFDFLLFAPGLFLLIAFEFFLELLIDVVVLGAELDGLGRPFFRRFEVAFFGIAGGERAEDVWPLVLGQITRFEAHLDRLVGVPLGILRR